MSLVITLAMALQSDPHAHHTQPAQPPIAAPLETPAASSEMARLQPAATLKPDALDAPAAASVAETQKASGVHHH